MPPQGPAPPPGSSRDGETPLLLASTMSTVRTSPARTSILGAIRPYLAIARPDHWFKNVFMALGVLLAYFYHPNLLGRGTLAQILWAVATTCLIASSNYVLNEILDAPTDLSHPVKRYRPIPSGQVRLPIAYAEWVLLGVTGLAMALALNQAFFYSG